MGKIPKAKCKKCKHCQLMESMGIVNCVILNKFRGIDKWIKPKRCVYFEKIGDKNE